MSTSIEAMFNKLIDTMNANAEIEREATEALNRKEELASKVNNARTEAGFVYTQLGDAMVRGVSRTVDFITMVAQTNSEERVNKKAAEAGLEPVYADSELTFREYASDSVRQSDNGAEDISDVIGLIDGTTEEAMDQQLADAEQALAEASDGENDIEDLNDLDV